MNYLEQLPVMVIKARKSGGEMVDVLVDGDYDGEYLSEFSWRVNPAGYVHTKTYNSESDKQEMLYIHRLVSGAPKGKWVRHLNGDKLDNRSANLQAMSPSKLITEFRFSKTPKLSAKHGNPENAGYSIYRGVYRNYKKKGQSPTLFNSWAVVVSHKNYGSYRSEVMAAKMYDHVATKLWGDRAILNFPKGEKT